tara:strand:- start:727 stop:1719 length:993 start_codon:yes stop_codon:yes gene_type:complete
MVDVEATDMTRQRIPRIVWQTSRHSVENLPSDLAAARRTAQEQNPEYEFKLVDDASADAFIRAEFAAPVHVAFRSLKWGVARADLWRYCVLLRRGGVYLDIDSRLRRPLRELIRPNDSAVLADELSHRARHGWRWGDGSWCKCSTTTCRKQLMQLRFNATKILQVPGQQQFDRCRSTLPRLHTQLAQFMLVFEPGHPFLAELIFETVRSIREWRDTAESLTVPLVARVLALTGPCAITSVFHRWVANGAACHEETDGTLTCAVNQLRDALSPQPERPPQPACFRLLPERNRNYRPYADRYFLTEKAYTSSANDNMSLWERKTSWAERIKI